MLKRFWNSARRAIGSPRTNSQRKEPRLETLESRQMLSVAGVDYRLSGFAWTNPGRITYSVPADGTMWDVAANDINAKLTASYGGLGWKREIAKALQTWASVANINVVPVSDSNDVFNTWGKTQGDPRFGDVRVGGYAYGELQTLAQTYYPPPSGLTGAGDVELNTSFPWNPGGSFDLYSVLLHETGHSLGLQHSANPAEVMNGTYGGVRTGLQPGDIAGIQAIYGPRVADSFQASGQGTALGNAVDLTSRLDSSNKLSIGGTSLFAVGDTEYFSVVAPNEAGASLRVAAMAAGISSLSPKVTVFDASMTPIVVQADPNSWSDNVIANVADVVPGGRYVIAVSGATNDVFSVGAYGLAVEFDGGSPPVVAPPPPIVPDRFEPNSNFNQPTNLGYVDQIAVAGLNLHVANDADIFTFQAARTGMTTITSGSTTLRVVDQYGRMVGSGPGAATFYVSRPGMRYFVVVTTLDGNPLADYTLAISINPWQPFWNVRATRRRQVVAPAIPNVVAPSATTANPVDTTRFGDPYPHQRVEVVTGRWQPRSRRHPH